MTHEQEKHAAQKVLANARERHLEVVRGGYTSGKRKRKKPADYWRERKYYPEPWEERRAAYARETGKAI